MNSQKASIAFLWALLAASLAIASGILRPFLRPAIYAIVIGIGFYPLHTQIDKLVRKRNASPLISTLAVLLIFVVPAVLLASVASVEMIGAAQYLSSKSTQEGGVVPYVTQALEHHMSWLAKYVNLERSGLKEALDSLPARASKLLFSVGTSLVAGLASFAVEAIITFFVLFFVFRDGASTTSQVAALLPLNPERVDRLLSRIRESVVANLYGILAVALAQGLLTGIAIMIVGARSPLLWGTGAALFSLVPLVGPALVWLPVAIFFLVTGHLWKGIFLIAWGAIVVGMADNIIRPLVIVGRVKLHPLLLLFALIGGVQQFGFIGLFIGPVVISVVLALVEMLREEMGEAQKEASISAPAA